MFTVLALRKYYACNMNYMHCSKTIKNDVDFGKKDVLFRYRQRNTTPWTMGARKTENTTLYCSVHFSD